MEGLLPPPVGTSDWARFSRTAMRSLRYFDCNCKPDAYWLDTSSNDIISAIVRDLPHDMVRTLEALLDRDADALARDARAQIDGKKYDATFRAEGIKDIEKIGLAYFKDKVELCKNL